MRPLRQWLAVERETKLPSSRILYTPSADQRESLVGTVAAVGSGVIHKGKVRRLDIMPGQRILYSSRVDQYRTSKAGLVDVIEEGSIIGVLL